VWNESGELVLKALLGHPDRSGLLRAQTQATPRSDAQADALGQAVAEALKAQGAAEWLAQAC
jgi:porphobilinogen deaminase